MLLQDPSGGQGGFSPTIESLDNGDIKECLETIVLARRLALFSHIDAPSADESSRKVGVCHPYSQPRQEVTQHRHSIYEYLRTVCPSRRSSRFRLRCKHPSPTMNKNVSSGSKIESEEKRPGTYHSLDNTTKHSVLII